MMIRITWLQKAKKLCYFCMSRSNYIFPSCNWVMYIEFLNSFSINTLKYESCRNMSKKLLIGISTMFPEFYFCLQEETTGTVWSTWFGLRTCSSIWEKIRKCISQKFVDMKEPFYYNSFFLPRFSWKCIKCFFYIYIYQLLFIARLYIYTCKLKNSI